MTKTDFGFRPDAAIGEQKQNRKSKQRQHKEKAKQAEKDMNPKSMPPWAQVLYRQNKAIMAELGIEE